MTAEQLRTFRAAVQARRRFYEPDAPVTGSYNVLNKAYEAVVQAFAWDDYWDNRLYEAIRRWSEQPERATR